MEPSRTPQILLNLTSLARIGRITDSELIVMKHADFNLLSISIWILFLFLYSDGPWAERPGFNSRQRHDFSLLHSVQTGTGARPPSYPMGFVGRNAAEE
jgi:hypothetical protein